jgi:molybdopterin synthase sulfur carrier subunit
MAVEVRIPTLLLGVTHGQKVVHGSGATVGDLLQNLDNLYPGLKSQLYSEDGKLHRFVNIYRNDEDIRYLGQLETPVQDGDVISILPAVAGGIR